MANSHKPGAGESGNNKTYTVVLRCVDAHFRVPAGRGILIRPINSEYGDFELKLLTRTDQVDGIEVPIPREIWIEVTGPAPSLQIAVNIASATASDFARQVAFAANAWYGVINVHLAYDSSAGRKEREFFQNWVPDERGLPRQAREIDPDLMYRVLENIAKTSKREKPRIIRAITQYTDALQYWKLGNDLYALAHLYMGVEAITETVIRAELRRRGLQKRKELEIELNGPPADSLLLRLATYFYVLAGGSRKETLGSWARLEHVFHGDKEIYLAAKKASDQLEHGVAAHQDVQRLAEKCVAKTAVYLRKSILSQLQLSEGDLETLTSKPYEHPTNTGGFERQFLATIISDDDDIAAPDQAYPIVRWDFQLRDFSIAEDGSHKMRVTQNMTPLIGESAEMRLERLHLAGATETTHSEVEIKVDKYEPDAGDGGVIAALNNPDDAKWLRPLGGVVSNCNSVRRLSKYWIQRLSIPTDDNARGFNFSENVRLISDFLSESNIESELAEQCKSEWQRALELDEIRIAFSGATTGGNGLVFYDELFEGQEKVMTDIKVLQKFVDRSVELAQSLIVLLDAVLAELGGRPDSDAQDGNDGSKV